MDAIIVLGFDGPAINGTIWEIREGNQPLEEVGTRQEALSRARNMWAAPGQEIRLINTKGKKTTIRQADPAKQPANLRHGGDTGLF